MYIMHRESYQQFLAAYRARTILVQYIKRLQIEMKLGFVKIAQPVALGTSGINSALAEMNGQYATAAMQAAMSASVNPFATNAYPVHNDNNNNNNNHNKSNSNTPIINPTSAAMHAAQVPNIGYSRSRDRDRDEDENASIGSKRPFH